ncbi:MAG TPA: Ig-like domain-containing protein, partial [Kofleriaceae bacterium]
LTPDERADLLAFLLELTPKGGAPLAIWPDLDSNRGVYPDVQPEIRFADPIDDTVPGTSASEVAARFVRLDDANGNSVDTVVSVDGGTIHVAPTAPLAAGKRYVVRVLPGLPFQSGGELDAERRSSFTVAAPAVGVWPEVMQLTVMVPSPMGGTSPMPLLVRAQPSTPGGLRVQLEPLVFGKQQRESLWLRIDGDTIYLEPFALPIAPTAVADASAIVGTVTASDGQITGASGTLRITGPGIDIPSVAFTLAPPMPHAAGIPVTSDAN